MQDEGVYSLGGSLTLATDRLVYDDSDIVKSELSKENLELI